ncbi:hypothetical protein ANN_09327 [Periplaneta americana]|uniref:Uncharacterized protein n=1 Tax=Periplaneta americana TaxID=6978 RepID=A0ABQ8TM00_PERAM|nr:hypothetical protein ANN_09327 [Periplaneta americana]
MDLREVGYDDRDWINLAQDRDRWRAYVKPREKISTRNDALEGMVNGRRDRGRRSYQMIDGIEIYGSCEETKRKAENRKDLRKLGLQ